MPDVGQSATAAMSASWTASSHRSKRLVPAQQRPEDLRRQLAQQVLDVRQGTQTVPPDSCRIGHTSIAFVAAKGCSATISSARFSLSASRIQKLDTNSFASR